MLIGADKMNDTRLESFITQYYILVIPIFHQLLFIVCARRTDPHIYVEHYVPGVVVYITTCITNLSLVWKTGVRLKTTLCAHQHCRQPTHSKIVFFFKCLVCELISTDDRTVGYRLVVTQYTFEIISDVESGRHFLNKYSFCTGLADLPKKNVF